MSNLKKTVLIAVGMSLIFCISCRRSLESKVVRQTLPPITRGENLVDPPAKVWKQYNCDAKQLPFVSVEGDYLDPSTVLAGQQLAHKIVYAMCSRGNNSNPIQGTIERKIYFRGELLSSKPKEFQIKPGRWSVGTFIEVPPQALPGIYELQTEFNSPAYKFKMSTQQFTVKK